MEKKYFLFILVLLGTLSQPLFAQVDIPDYMKMYSKSWAISPKKAAMEWFKEAQFGMFVHFSPASMLPDNSDFSKKDVEWFRKNNQSGQLDQYDYKQYLHEKLYHVNNEVEKVINAFNPEKFSADSIADLAVSAGMKYITFTSQHVGGRLFMFDTSVSKCNSVKLCGRDFVKELSDACQQRGLGLFLYVMPPADMLQTEIRQMLKELLTNYGPIAGIWFDGIWSCYVKPTDYIESGRLYSFVNDLQPQCLISFKTGFTGDEDFLAPEWHQLKYNEKNELIFQGKVPDADRKLRVLRQSKSGGLEWRSQAFADVWRNELVNKHVELCTTMIKGNRWFNDEKGVHKTADEVLQEYNHTKKNQANYLLNVAPRGDGSIHPDDYKALQGFRKKIGR